MSRVRRRGSPVDPEMVTPSGARASAMGGCRAEKQLHIVASAMQIGLYMCSIKRHAVEHTTYWLACRRLMGGGTSDCIVADVKRFGGALSRPRHHECGVERGVLDAAARACSRKYSEHFIHGIPWISEKGLSVFAEDFRLYATS